LRDEVGATLTTVEGAVPYAGKRLTLALAANTGTMIDNMLTLLLDIGSNINIIGLETAQIFENIALANGHTMRRLNISPPLHVTGVGNGAAVCRSTGHFKIVCKYRDAPAGQPAVPSLEIYNASIAEGCGESLPAILGRRSMAKNRGILILEEGREKYILPGNATYKILLGKGARVVDLIKTPSGHLAMKVDAYAGASDQQSEKTFALNATEGQPHTLEEANAGQPASSAGQPASSSAEPTIIGPGNAVGAHAFMMMQSSRTINDCTETEAFDWSIKNLVDDILHSWHGHRKDAGHPVISSDDDRDDALKAIQAKVYQAIQSRGEQWIPYDAMRRWVPPAAQPAEGTTAPERYDIASASNDTDRE